ncbi:MAG TPA: prenyltransferase/squalene oxidase repeat-containing protein [Planctomycetota bacterium]
MALVLLLALAQGKLDPAKVDEAVVRGVKHLKPHAAANQQDLELTLLALVHGGVAPVDPAFADGLERALAQELAMTYRVALLAMTLEEVDRLRYQNRIARCAQFLLDSQGENGQWSYGRATTYPSGLPVDSTDPREAGQVVVFEEPKPGAKPAVRQKIKVAQQRVLPAGGDNSNSQYAALGLRACHDAGIVLPAEAVTRAADWWRTSQSPDGGWGYNGNNRAYGSMTVGAIGARAILLHIQGRDWKRDPVLRAGVDWETANFTVTDNPFRTGGHVLYYLYGLERAGMLCEIQKFGPNDWYASGARHLLTLQKPDGSWGPHTDTAFAILFLKRATRSMVESGR